MRKIIRRWSKQPRNVIVIDASLIRSVIIDNLDLSIPEVLQDFVQEHDDFSLNLIGEDVAQDAELWDTLTHVIIAYVTTYKFSELLDDGGLLDEY